MGHRLILKTMHIPDNVAIKTQQDISIIPMSQVFTYGIIPSRSYCGAVAITSSSRAGDMEGLNVEPLLIQLKDYYTLVHICISNQNSLPLYLKWGHHVANLELLKGDDTINKQAYATHTHSQRVIKGNNHITRSDFEDTFQWENSTLSEKDGV